MVEVLLKWAASTITLDIIHTKKLNMRKTGKKGSEFLNEFNWLEKICIVFVFTCLIGASIAVLGAAAYLLWTMSPLVALFVTLFVSACVYLLRDDFV